MNKLCPENMFNLKTQTHTCETRMYMYIQKYTQTHLQQSK